MHTEIFVIPWYDKYFKWVSQTCHAACKLTSVVLVHTGSILNQDSEVHTGGKAANFHLYLYEVHTKHGLLISLYIFHSSYRGLDSPFKQMI